MTTDVAQATTDARARTLKALLKARRVSEPKPAEGFGVVAANSAAPGAIHFEDRGGLILKDVELWLIYWGTAWHTEASPTASDISQAAEMLLAGPYMSGLSQYRGINGGSVKGSIRVTDSDPRAGFSARDIVNMINSQLQSGALPEPDEAPSALYCVILPPGVTSDHPEIIGAHSYFTYFDVTDLSLPPDFDISRAHYAWVTNDGSLDTVTTILSHELVESCTDPNGNGWQGTAGSCSQTGWCEIGDVCSATESLDGVRVQAYWSEQAQTCLVPGLVTVETPGPPPPPPPPGPAAPEDQAPVPAAGQAAAASAPSSQRAKRRNHLLARYVGGLLATGWLAPIIATIVTVAVYVAPKILPPWAQLVSDSPALGGPLVGIIGWLLVAAAYAPLACARNANISSYADLREQWTHLSARIDTLPPIVARPSALLEARAASEFMAEEFEDCGPKWVAAVGYIGLWKRLHRADEALLHIEQRSHVVADGIYDAWRIQNSRMDNAPDLLADLERARQYLDTLPPDDAQPGGAPLSAARIAADAVAKPIESEAEARAIISKVRYAINDYRDQRWAALIKARNLLMGTMIITELFAFALLALAVIEHAPPTAIVAGIVFYLVGALVGLYNRLGQQAASGTIVGDYSLAGIRLILTPTISGLAAVGGVVLTGMLAMSGLTGLVQPGGSGSSTSPVTLPILADIFDLNKFRIGLLLALLFGGAPALLNNRLQQLTDEYKNDLKSTEPTSAANPTATTPAPRNRPK